MALAVDASTPALKKNNGGSPTSNTVTSPPANSGFLLCFANPIDLTTISSISGGGLSWSKLVGSAADNADAELWWAFGSPSSFAATLTMSGSLITLSGGYSVAIIVFTGAASIQNGHVKTSAAGSGAPSATLTAAAADSWILGIVSNDSKDVNPTVPSGQTTTWNGNSMVNLDTNDVFSSWVQGNSAAGNSNLTINDTAPTGSDYSMAIVEILAGSGGGGSFTASDTSLSTDSASKNVVLARTTSDTSTSGDSAAQNVALARSAPDTTATSDTAARAAQSFARFTADTTLSGDSASRTTVLARLAGDTSLTSDAASRALRLARSGSDTSASTDSASRTLRLGRAGAETSSTSDSAQTGSGAGARSASDTSASTDSAARAITLPRSASDTTTSTDSAARHLALPRATSDTSLSSDSTTRAAVHYVRSASDTSLSSDSASLPGTAAPKPPCITPPTTATIALHSSAASISSHTATAAIVAYASHAAIADHESDATLGPTYC